MSRHDHTAPISKKRITALALCMLLFLSYLATVLLRLQIFSYDIYRDRVYEQITTTSPLIAQRGDILDRNGNVLATTKTVWRLFVSTRDIALYSERDSKDYARIIASGLSPILSLSEQALYEKMTGSRVLDVTLKKAMEAQIYEKCMEFIIKNKLERLVFTEAQSSRYYPNGTAFAHVLGFTGSDNQGLYGLEYSYNTALSGKNGYYLYAKDANGNELPSEYATYVPPKNGQTLVTTLDLYVQEVLEGELETIRQTHNVQNRVTGIVMDTKTGAILGMATTSPFDPNTPYVLDAQSLEKLLTSGYSEDSEEYKKLKKELLEIMWSNKAVSETYEPGSTFKIVTVSTALECGAASINDRFSCHGSYAVGGWIIRCHKQTGHGSGFTLAYGLQMSCNPTMMAIAERIGAKTFYESIERFGYFEKTGIDLPSEPRTIFHKLENIGSTELATISFGQRFKVSILSQLCAVAAVANGGVRVTPHVMQRLTDEDGNLIKEYQQQQERRVISEAVAATVSRVLEEGVSGDGGAKNAYVDGYKVAAKTGTSQKFDQLDANGNSYLRIGSTVGYAPADTGGVAIIIVVDEPMSTVKYGSVVAAPYVSSVLSRVLPYLEYEPNQEKTQIELASYTGLPINGVAKQLKDSGLTYEVVGKGNTVLSQVPAAGESVTKGCTKVILYTEPRTQQTVRVPNVVGKSGIEANEILTELGLNLCILGVPDLKAEDVRVCEQSLPPDSETAYGSVITLRLLSMEHEE